MTTPADWYPDPFGRHDHRYWNGAQWTDHVATAGQQAIDSNVVATPPASAVDAASTPADWYPDPFDQHLLRYWDGIQWTEHVSSGQQPAIDRPPTGATGTVTGRPNRKVKRQGRKVVSESDELGGGTLFTEPVLVVNQKAKMFGGTLGYAIFDQLGRQLGMVEEVPRGFKAKAGDSFHGRTDDTREYRFRIVDMNHRVLLTITRPAKWALGRSKMVVEDPAGMTIGHISQETHGLVGGLATVTHAVLTSVPAIAGAGIGLVAGATVRDSATNAAGKAAGWVGERAGLALGIAASDRIKSATEGLERVGHVRFGLEADGERLGSIHAETIEAWDFRIQDPTGTEFARITKTWGGWTKGRFTKADSYVVQMERQLQGPLLSLVIAAALAVDVALKPR